jgi:hypothetical protein
MIRWLGIFLGTLRSAVRTRRELALENLALRQQLSVWKARQPRPRLTEMDRVFWGRAVEALEEFPEFFAGGAARDCGAVAPSGLQALLGVEESATIRSARD